LKFAVETLAIERFSWRRNALKFLQEILLTTSLNSIAVSILGQFVKDLSGLRKAKRWCCALCDDTMNGSFMLPFRLVH